MISKPTSLVTAALLLGGLMIVASPGAATASHRKCGQPQTNGDNPFTSDALAVLNAAVGQSVPNCSDEHFCICDVNRTGTVNTTDALLVLRKAVGLNVTFNCNCVVDGIPCTSAQIFTREGSDLDTGVSGLAHNSDIILNASITMRVKRECSITDTIECETDDDCPGSETCEATCNCLDDTSCEATGPTHDFKCQNDLSDCTTNADCDFGQPCVQTFGPPLPLASGGTPVCVITKFASPITGTADSATGEAEIAVDLKSRIYLGPQLDKPCPVCGLPIEEPEVGQEFTCDGGPNAGLPCTVEGVSPDFGGTSTDCPPPSGTFQSEIAIRFNEVTTGTTTRTAQLPCRFFGFTANPLVPGSNPKCIDKTSGSDPVCTSNADCKRCTEDIATTCTTNGDCTGKGFCGTAPDQPVTCGFWCHCGLCNGNPALPCFNNGECPDGQNCIATSSAQVNKPDAPQLRPNECSNDKFICGATADETCETTEKYTCSEQDYRQCDPPPEEDICPGFNAGVCQSSPKSCFESRITRTGTPSPLGTYCAFEVKPCTTNADCTQEDDFCAPDSSRSETVALFCVPGTSSQAINSAGGIPGPGAISLQSFLQVCRCGDGKIGCDEECDDSNTLDGDTCTSLCQNP